MCFGPHQEGAVAAVLVAADVINVVRSIAAAPTPLATLRTRFLLRINVFPLLDVRQRCRTFGSIAETYVWDF
jgi:hypothetical protein